MFTPEFLAKAEDEMNAMLALARPGHRVCLHPDRSVTELPVRGDHIVECDYCATSAWWGPGAPVPELMPNYYTDPGVSA